MERNNKKRQRGLPTQMNLIIHIVVGVYLLYLAYSVFNSDGEVNRIVMIAFSLIFCIVGVVLITSSVRSLQRGEYEGGAADTERENGGERGKRTENEETGSPGRIRFGEPETLPEGALEGENSRSEEKEENGRREEKR